MHFHHIPRRTHHPEMKATRAQFERDSLRPSREISMRQRMTNMRRCVLCALQDTHALVCVELTKAALL
jgi:hypothetical protein